MIDRVPEELWTEVLNIVQEVEIKTIPKKKKFYWAKWLSEEASQTAEKRREMKGKEEKESHLNAKFYRLVRRDKKALSEQCKEIEENNKMGKTRDVFKKSRNSKGTFCANMGTIGDRNSMDLTELEEVAKHTQKTTQKRS